MTPDERLWLASRCTKTCCSLPGKLKKDRRKKIISFTSTNLVEKQQKNADNLIADDKKASTRSKFSRAGSSASLVVCACVISEHCCASFCRPSLETVDHGESSFAERFLRSSVVGAADPPTSRCSNLPPSFIHSFRDESSANLQLAENSPRLSLQSLHLCFTN